MNKTLKQTLLWTPRIAGVLFILFISMFALDVFDGKSGFWKTALALFMHLIPSILLTIAVIVAWMREWFGAAFFIGWAIFYIVAFPEFEWFVYMLIAGLPALIGFFFLAGWIW